MDSFDPEVLSGVRNEVNQFLVALQPFERDDKDKVDAKKLETLFRAIMTNLISTNIKERDFFIAPELIDKEMNRGEFILPEGCNLVPHLFFYKVVEGNVYVPAPDPDFSIRIASNRNAYIDIIENTVGRMLSERAYYEMQHGRKDRAMVYLKKVRKDFPEFQMPRTLLELLEQ